MTTQHTPGPWHTEPEEWTEGRGIAICDNDGIVAIVDPECEDIAACDEAQANARLIASAPALLKVLEKLVRRAENGDTIEPGWYEIEDAGRIVAEAKGGQLK